MANFGVATQGPPTVFVKGELDMATVLTLEGAIRDAVPHGGPITLDLSGMTFIDSSGVQVILKAANALPSGCLTIHGAQDATHRIFDIMRMGEAPNVHVIPCSVPVTVG
ncbi:MAG TPA: STAS domain-containing protein [Actinomycetota bacterium]|nr:STAS domain-containing protein [Actinomycetota bacterium]